MDFEFPIPNDRDSIVDLSRRVLAEVYSMRRGDILDYHFLTKAAVDAARSGLHGQQ
jgi:hypothetical protein